MNKALAVKMAGASFLPHELYQKTPKLHKLPNSFLLYLWHNLGMKQLNGGGMGTALMTIKDVAEYLRLSEQTIQRYVLKRTIPFHKVHKVIRFRLSEIERWIDNGGGGDCTGSGIEDREGDLFAEAEAVECGVEVKE
jgi:excisionase family DNA binding protein